MNTLTFFAGIRSRPQKLPTVPTIGILQIVLVGALFLIGGSLSHSQEKQKAKNGSATAQEVAPIESDPENQQPTHRPQYAAIEDLPPALRERFDAAMLRYRRAKEAVNQIDKRAQDDPVLSYVLEQSEQAEDTQRKRNALTEPYQAFLTELQANSPEDFRQLMRWQILHSQMQAAEHAKRLAEKPAPVDLDGLVFYRVVASRSREQLQNLLGFEHLLDFLPVDPKSMTLEQAGPICRKWLIRLGEVHRGQYETLDRTLTIPQEIRDYWQYSLLADRAAGCQMYLEQEYEPARASAANDLAGAYNELNSLWPDWGRLMKAGEPGNQQEEIPPQEHIERQTQTFLHEFMPPFIATLLLGLFVRRVRGRLIRP